MASTNGITVRFDYVVEQGIVGDYDQEWMIIATAGNVVGPLIQDRRSSGESRAGSRNYSTEVAAISNQLANCTSETLRLVCTDEPEKERSKDWYLQQITAFLNNNSAKGATIWYFGYGQKQTGNWCFRNGEFISFDDLFTIYMNCFRGQLLSLVLDCPFAGAWPQACLKKFDDMGIPPCGHQLRQRGIMLKFFASCQANEVPVELGFALKSTAPDGRYMWYKRQPLDTHQCPSFLNLTKISCLRRPYEDCRVRNIYKWKDLADPNWSKRIVLVHGKNNGQPTWHYVLLCDSTEIQQAFFEQMSKSSMDVENYGEVLKSGWGTEPPDYIKGALPVI